MLLEEFTGIQCGMYPDGHRMVNGLKAAKPVGSVVIANIYTGGYAQPVAGSDWSKYANSTSAKSSYLNIALQGILEIATRTLTVMLLEDGVAGPQ